MPRVDKDGRNQVETSLLGLEAVIDTSCLLGTRPFTVG